MDDHELAGWLASGAGRLLECLCDGRLEPVALGFVADQTANAFLISALNMLRPGDHVLSEESPDSPERLAASRVWIIDPLDGTREFTEGRDDWAVHVALTLDGIPVAGAVAQSRGRLAGTCRPRPPPERSGPPVMLVSRTRRPPGAEALARDLGADLQAMGSAGAKAMAIVAGEADIYFHTGGQHEWDNCAPVAAAQAAGLVACRADGTPIRYNRPDLRVPDLIIGRPEIARRAIELLAGAK
jgi:3'(2'), 5'-bisphosphate nucleotidase